MKESYYNLYTPVNQGVLCFNTYSDTFAILPQSVYSALMKNKFSSLNPDKLEMLKNSHLIIDDEIDEYKLLVEEYKRVEYSGIYYLTILPSLDCNVRCWYCFEKHIKGSHLTLQQQERIFKYAKQVLDRNDINTLFITLFGGEPLLYFKEEVYPLLLRIKEYAESIDKYITLSVTTNALCIDKTSVSLFAEFKTMFQISIDGYRKKHNSVKRAPNIQNAYEIVMNAIHLLSDTYDAHINLRVNYDNQTLKHLPSLIKDIDDVDRSKIKIHLERIWQTFPAKKTEGLTLADAINLLLSKDFCVTYLNFSRRNIACINDAKNGAIISYDGIVYKCTGRDFIEELSEGTLSENGCIIWNESKVKKRQKIKTYDNPVCRVCKLLPQCWGPCSQKQLENPENMIDLCPLKNMEITIDEYISYRFNNTYVCKQNYGDRFPIEFI